MKKLNQIIEGILLDLSGKYRLFRDAVVQLAGSMIEGTKIGQPDEFDYVFVLPFEPFYADEYNMNNQSTELILKIKDLSFMDDILGADILCPEWCDQDENEQRRSQQLIFKDGKVLRGMKSLPWCLWRNSQSGNMSPD